MGNLLSNWWIFAALHKLVSSYKLTETMDQAENGIKTEPNPQTLQHTSPPFHEVVGGSSVRQYLNKHLTQHVLDGLRQVAHHKPENPLRVLGEFLIERSKTEK